jgi:hypothetical protein
MSTPLHLAFFDEQSHFSDIEEGSSNHWETYNIICDLFFLVDITVCFNTMYVDDDFVIVNRRSKIAKRYMLGWFSIDAVAIFPFDRVISL